MRNNVLSGLKTRLICQATGMWLAFACFASGGPGPSPFELLEEAPTPAAREAMLQEWRAFVPPVSKPITSEEREKLVQVFIQTHNPAIVEVLGAELIPELIKRYRDVVINEGRYQNIRYALFDALERTDLPEQIKETGRSAVLDIGLNSSDTGLKEATLSEFASREKEGATDLLLRMMDDPKESARSVALELLGEFGRPEAASVIAAKLQQRAKGLDRKAIENDFSFASGRDAIAKLSARARGAGSAPTPEKVDPGRIPGLVRMAEPEEIFPNLPKTPNPVTPAPPKPERVPQEALSTPALLKPTTPAAPSPGAEQTPAVVIERKSPRWLWLVGIVALVVIVVMILKRRAQPPRR